MRLNLFGRSDHEEPDPQGPEQQPAAAVPPLTGKTFPADEVVWGIVIRNGFDELDDPVYHRGTTQHAYLEGNDNVSICGFRPPQSGPRTRRRPRLGLPTAGQHPMCGSCARMVVAPRPRVPVPVQRSRPAVPVPVAAPTLPSVPAAVPAAQVAQATAPAPAAPEQAEPSVSPWVRNRTDAPDPEGARSIDLGARHDSGLLQRGVHLQPED